MDTRPVVVGAAILDGDRLLAAQRSAPPALAGRWELPGGKVDPGETDESALLRECREELGVDVHLGRRVGRDWPIGEHGVLRVWMATLAGGQPQCREHAQLRWLTLDELHDVDWLPADLPIVEKLAAMLLDRAVPRASDDVTAAEVPLPGGNCGGAVRVGATVRRPAGRWTPAVHELLAHLDTAGLDAVPRVLGIDDVGREVLEYVPGDTAHAHEVWPAWVWSDALLAQTARWLRRYHQAVAGFEPLTNRWRFADRPLADEEIVCHHDVAPYNVVVGFDATGEPKLRCVIDWDVAGPGTPLDDLAFMAWNFVPCWDESRHDDATVVRRVMLLTDTYGSSQFLASTVLEAIPARVEAAITAIVAGAAANDTGMQNLVAGGHPERMRVELDAFVARLPRLRKLLDRVPERDDHDG